MSNDTLMFVILGVVVFVAVVWFIKNQQPRRPYTPSIPSSRPTFMVDLSPEEKQRSAAQFIQSKLGEGEARRTIKDIAEACGLTVESAQMNAQATVAPPRPMPTPSQQPPAQTLPNP